jgi:hypothetical protein
LLGCFRLLTIDLSGRPFFSFLFAEELRGGRKRTIDNSVVLGTEETHVCGTKLCDGCLKMRTHFPIASENHFSPTSRNKEWRKKQNKTSGKTEKFRPHSSRRSIKERLKKQKKKYQHLKSAWTSIQSAWRMGSVSVEWIAHGRETFREFEGMVACRWNGVGVTAIRQIGFHLHLFSP